jgi:hypothetical protein
MLEKCVEWEWIYLTRCRTDLFSVINAPFGVHHFIPCWNHSDRKVIELKRPRKKQFPDVSCRIGDFRLSADIGDLNCQNRSKSVQIPNLRGLSCSGFPADSSEDTSHEEHSLETDTEPTQAAKVWAGPQVPKE